METIIITDHAIKRAQKRFKWNSKTLKKMAGKAYNQNSNSSEKIYGDTVYVFKGNILTTIFKKNNSSFVGGKGSR